MSGLGAALGPPVFHEFQRRIWRCEPSAGAARSRAVAEETPVAFAYQGTSYAVMMATPADLEDFAVGFSLNEGVIRSPNEIEALDIVRAEDGIVLRMVLANGQPMRSGNVDATFQGLADAVSAVSKALLKRRGGRAR